MNAAAEHTPVVHIHAPRPSLVRALDDGHCRERARDGRQCGSYRYLAWFTDWYGWYFACYHCGATQADGEYLGKQDVRQRWHDVQGTQTVTR